VSVRGGTAGRWVVLITAATSVVLAGLGALLVTTALNLRTAQLRQTNVYAAAGVATSDLLGDFVDEETGLRGYVITQSAYFLKPSSPWPSRGSPWNRPNWAR
jgi:CHASE3 domain sensor protein